MMAPIKVGIVGYGFSTKCFHLPFILPNPDLEVYAFLQRAADPSQVKKHWGHCTIDFPQAKHYTTAEDFFADDAIDLVVVCSHAHDEFVEGALRTGKHVVVEKPFVTNADKANKLIELAQTSGKVLSIFHNRRFDSDFRTLRDLVERGALGDVMEAQMHFDFPDAPWVSTFKEKYTPGSGMLFGLGSHTLDQAICLFGRPASVTAFLRANRGAESEVDDTFTVILQYGGDKKNLLVTVKTAIITHMKDQLKFWVRGTGGTYLKFGTCPQEARALAAPGQPATDPDFGLEDEGIWGTLTTTKEFDPKSQKWDEASKHYIGKYPSLRGSYREYYERVVDAIRGKGPVPVSAEDARDGLRVMELARESHEKGCTVAWY